MERKDALIKQREIVDQLIALYKQLHETNRNLDQHDKTDLLMVIGQHRHEFEEQKVADHSLCITSQCITGSYSGVCGGLAMLAVENPTGRKMIREINKFLDAAPGGIMR